MNNLCKFVFAFALFFTSVNMEKQLMMNKEGEVVSTWNVSLDWGAEARAEVAAKEI